MAATAQRRPGRLRWSLAVAILVAFAAAGGAAAAPGDLDPTFSGDGRWVKETTMSDWTTANDLLVQPDGSLLMVGQFGITSAWAIKSITADGSAEIGAGSYRLDLGDNDTVNAVARQADGNLVVVGTAGQASILGRLTWPNVLRDPSFDGDGTVLLFGGLATDVLVQPDGRIVVVGYLGNEFAIRRFDPNGALDPSFSTDGQVTVSMPSPADPEAVAMQSDGKLVVVGQTKGAAADIVVVRLSPSGELDPTFDADGIRVIDRGGDDAARAVLVQPDGKLLVAGRGGTDLELLRLVPDGGLDASFAGDGSLTRDLGGTDIANDAALTASGKIVVAAAAQIGSSSEASVLQVLPDGTPDPAFDSDGIEKVQFGTNDVLNAIAVQPDGRIVAAGTTGTGNARAMAVVRLVGEPPPVATPPAPPPAPAPTPPSPAPAPAGPTCNGLPATIVGTAGIDRLTGTAGPDVIVGLGGGDVIDARGGDDVVCAGGGADLVKGGNGADTLFGQAGKDDLRGGAGADALDGGPGADLLRGGGGEDGCTGGKGKDAGLGCESGTL